MTTLLIERRSIVLAIWGWNNVKGSKPVELTVLSVLARGDAITFGPVEVYVKATYEPLLGSVLLRVVKLTIVLNVVCPGLEFTGAVLSRPKSWVAY